MEIKQSFRIPILPASVKDGVLSFNTVKIICFVDDNNPIKSFIEKSEPVNIYLDPSKEPKFSKCSTGGWCSPPEEKAIELENAGIEIEDQIIIKCKCQKEDCEPGDTLSLEQCGHRRTCPKATIAASQNYQQTPTAIPAVNPGIDPEVMARVEYGHGLNLPAKAPENYCPLNGVPSLTTIPDLVAYMEGVKASEISVEMGLEAIGWTEPYNDNVVIKELARFNNFTICNGCGNWATVLDLANPKCVGCANTQKD